MSDLRYRFITPAEEQRLGHVASSLLGRRLVDVRYRTWLDPGVWPHDDYPATPVFHQIDDSLVIKLDDGQQLEIGGVMPGFSWGIDIQLVGETKPPSRRLDVNVGATAEWARLLGRQVSSVAVAWMHNDQGEPDTVWACRLDLSGDAVIVVALGWADQGVIQPHPDNLVVIFDADTASRLCIKGADCAPGRVIATASP